MTLRENMRRSMETLSAAWRQGTKEIGAAFYGSQTVAQAPEYGMPNTRLPSEIAEGRQSIDIDISADSGRSLADRVKNTEPPREVEPLQRDVDMTRD